MADVIADGFTRVSWVLTIANTAAPTVAELNAGVPLESFITPDGYQTNVTTNKIDTSALNSVQNTGLTGRRDDTIKVVMKQQGKANVPWSTFNATPSGYIVRRSDIAAATAWATSQKVTVFPVQAGFRDETPPAINAVAKFEVDFIVSGIVQDNATVA